MFAAVLYTSTLLRDSSKSLKRAYDVCEMDVEDVTVHCVMVRVDGNELASYSHIASYILHDICFYTQ